MTLTKIPHTKFTVSTLITPYPRSVSVFHKQSNAP